MRMDIPTEGIAAVTSEDFRSRQSTIVIQTIRREREPIARDGMRVGIENRDDLMARRAHTFSAASPCA